MNPDSTKLAINAVDGLDGAGKGEITEAMAQIYLENGRNVLLVDYPQYQTPWGKILKKLLAEGGGDLSVWERMAIYALNRLESVDLVLAETSQIEGELTIVFDRYATSNIITAAYYLANGSLGGFTSKEIEEYLESSSDEVQLYINEIFEIDSEFINLLNLEGTKVCVPRVSPEISLARLKGDSSREQLDTYEKSDVQITADYLYAVASKIDSSNIYILEQSGRDPKSIAKDIVEFYGKIEGNSKNPQVVRIKMGEDLSHSEEVKAGMQRLLTKFPRLQNLVGES